MLDPARVERLSGLIAGSRQLVSQAVEDHIVSQGKRLAAVCVLFSGGNDSTVLAHLFHTAADYAIHINTGIGIDDTRTFVRETCQSWDWPLIEEHPPPGSTYEELVLDQGFPGPAHHWKMYQRLKERGLRQARRRLVTSRNERVVFLAGRRRDESKRRANAPELERVGSVVWVSPLVEWTKLDLNAYRLTYPDVPRNEVADKLHMSGECLCGAFAHKEELDEIGFWYPEVKQRIVDLEKRVEAAGKKHCRWGWGASQSSGAREAGPLCTSCDSRFAVGG